MLEGSQHKRLRKDLELCFESVRTVKPRLSKAERDGMEFYFVCKTFVGDNRNKKKVEATMSKLQKENNRREKLIRYDKKNLKLLKENPLVLVLPLLYRSNSYYYYTPTQTTMYTVIIIIIVLVVDLMILI